METGLENIAKGKQIVITDRGRMLVREANQKKITLIRRTFFEINKSIMIIECAPEKLTSSEREGYVELEHPYNLTLKFKHSQADRRMYNLIDKELKGVGM